jgi:hypothetical protein
MGFKFLCLSIGAALFCQTIKADVISLRDINGNSCAVEESELVSKYLEFSTKAPNQTSNPSPNQLLIKNPAIRVGQSFLKLELVEHLKITFCDIKKIDER